MDQEEGYRLVHLDLKGAPPKLSYLQQIFPLLKQWKANGLLIEYEDMFPYEGELKPIANPWAYSKDDIRTIRELAQENDLMIIPLIQTFGHFEFVLKHPEFYGLREVKEYTRSLCPSHPDSMRILSAMIDQVLELHPKLKWFHIGADEVYHIGECDACIKRMAEEGLSKEKLFLAHVWSVANCVKQKSPLIRLIMWDDMYRQSDMQSLKESGVGELVEPMIWHYQPCDIPVVDIWDKYSGVFSNIWMGSAFKGATGIYQYATDITFHLGNHFMWLSVLEKHASKFDHIRGIALTGWQRYDHFTVLCELLPAAIPCLGMCLHTIDTGLFTSKVHERISEDLHCSSLLPLNPFQLPAVPECSFPGSHIYTLSIGLVHLDALLEGYITNHQLRLQSGENLNTDPLRTNKQTSSVTPDIHRLLDSYEEMKQKFSKTLLEVFFPNTVVEWVDVHISPKIMRLKSCL